MLVPARSMAWMKLKVAAPVDTWPLSAAVSAAVWLSRAAPNWMASPPRVPCRSHKKRSATFSTRGYRQPSAGAGRRGLDVDLDCSSYVL